MIYIAGNKHSDFSRFQKNEKITEQYIVDKNKE